MARDRGRGAARCPEVDFVAGVPDSGVPRHAIGYATGEQRCPSPAPSSSTRPPGRGRSCRANQELRNHIANMKQVPASPSSSSDKKLLFVDDSIVRGTQLRETVDFLYDAGARRRCTCAPPARPSCTAASTSPSRAGKSDMDLIARRVVRPARRRGGRCRTSSEYADATHRARPVPAQDRSARTWASIPSSYQSRCQGMLEAIGIDPVEGLHLLLGWPGIG